MDQLTSLKPEYEKKSLDYAKLIVQGFKFIIRLIRVPKINNSKETLQSVLH